MVITRKIIVGICIVCAVGTSHSSMAQNRVVTQHTAGTVVEGEVTMLVTQGDYYPLSANYFPGSAGS